MAEPVQGIRAVPDEQNSRYFHVVVAGPKDVSSLDAEKPYRVQTLTLLCVCYVLGRVLMRMGRTNWNCFYQTNTQWLHPKCASWQKYITRTSTSSAGYAWTSWKVLVVLENFARMMYVWANWAAQECMLCVCVFRFGNTMCLVVYILSFVNEERLCIYNIAVKLWENFVTERKFIKKTFMLMNWVSSPWKFFSNSLRSFYVCVCVCVCAWCRQVESSTTDKDSTALHTSLAVCSQPRWPSGKRCRWTVEEKRVQGHWNRFYNHFLPVQMFMHPLPPCFTNCFPSLFPASLFPPLLPVSPSLSLHFAARQWNRLYATTK